MIVAAALVPHPPLLLRELGGAWDPVPELRAAVLATVHGLVEGVDDVVVVGSAGEARGWDPSSGVDAHPFGAPRRSTGGESLPLSLGVGTRLLHEVGWVGPVLATSVTWSAADADLVKVADALAQRDGRTAVLLLGDGSARRGERAPGYLDERAFAFDDALAKALTDGDATALADLDTLLAEELLVLGAPAFRLLGLLALRQPGPPLSGLSYRDDPFGVSYLVSTWRFSAPDHE